MIRMPSRKLPPSAEPWGRAVDAELASISRTNEKQAQDTNNALSAINGTLTRLGEQVGEIRTITETLVVQQATLEAQQEQLQAQQTQLTATVAELQIVVEGMIRPARAVGGIADFSISTTDTALTSAIFTVPSGYTRALVFSVATLSARNNKTSDDFVYFGVRTGGTSYTPSFGSGLKDGGWTTVSAHGTRLLSNLSEGQQITVEAMARTQIHTWDALNNSVYLDSQILWLR